MLPSRRKENKLPSEQHFNFWKEKNSSLSFHLDSSCVPHVCLIFWHSIKMSCTESFLLSGSEFSTQTYFSNLILCLYRVWSFMSSFVVFNRPKWFHLHKVKNIINSFFKSSPKISFPNLFFSHYKKYLKVKLWYYFPLWAYEIIEILWKLMCSFMSGALLHIFTLLSFGQNLTYAYKGSKNRRSSKCIWWMNAYPLLML